MWYSKLMAERPLECASCSKETTVKYSEVVDGNISAFTCCQECPTLHARLHGKTELKPTEIKEQGMCCSNCGTDLQAIQTGSPLGCSECYTVFEEVIRTELGTDKSHVGRSKTAPELSNRLTELNLELNEALKKENYEQAAWLRDQIKELMNERS